MGNVSQCVCLFKWNNKTSGKSNILSTHQTNKCGLCLTERVWILSFSLQQSTVSCIFSLKIKSTIVEMLQIPTMNRKISSLKNEKKIIFRFGHKKQKHQSEEKEECSRLCLSVFIFFYFLLQPREKLFVGDLSLTLLYAL